MLERHCYNITGYVQGVGFRPSIYRLAHRLHLVGFVQNSTTGVIIEVQGEQAVLEKFNQLLPTSYPPMAMVATISRTTIPSQETSDFTITPSERSGDLFAGMPADMATCPECQKELFDPHDRRFLYPFINCTNCGPRFSIIKSLPYDRDYTSMKTFTQCSLCQTEYDQPDNRRFDAQPNACFTCGPWLQVVSNDNTVLPTENPVATIVEALKSGKIAAIKSLGGYNLCCDAKNETAITTLRSRKKRPHKALAVMFRSLDEVKQFCSVSAKEAEWLLSPIAPIVILNQLDHSCLPKSISPDTSTIGAFLPYTPLHHLLLSQVSPLIMTSANQSDEPIVIDEEQLTSLLGSIADISLVHNRAILRRADDSVMRLVDQQPLFYRRSRGLVPHALALPKKSPDMLACGADLKNTFALTKNDQLYLSQHIGDLKDYPTYSFYQDQINDFKNLLQVSPKIILHDMHPDYVSTGYAQSLDAEIKLPIQHHHAHIVSCMTEHQLKDPVIGIALDGTGYGDDQHLWGGEVFIADLKHYTRHYHFEYVALPGKEEAIRHPERMAFSYLNLTFSPNEALNHANTYLPNLSSAELDVLRQLIPKPGFSPLTSSAGRLFDGIAALLGFTGPVSYEGQAAIQLESLVDPQIKTHYDYALIGSEISFQPMITGLLKDRDQQLAVSTIAAKCHLTITMAVTECAQKLGQQSGIKQVVLSGGVFQNVYLLKACIKSLSNLNFQVYCHQQVPPNDAGLALGQAAIGQAILS